MSPQFGRLFSLILLLSSFAAPLAAQPPAEPVESPETASDESSAEPIAEPPAGEEAQRAFETGMQAFDEGDYALSVEAFEQTYRLAPHPDIQFNIYSAAERGGQLERAAAALEQYLLTGEPGARREVLVRRLARLRVRIEERASAAAVPQPEARPRPVPPPASPPPAEGVHPAGPILLVSGAVLLASFGAFAALAAVEDAALAGSCGRDAGRSCSADAVAGLEGLTLAADIAWVSAATLGVVGLVLTWVLEPEDGMRLSVAPWLSPEGGARGVM